MFKFERDLLLLLSASIKSMCHQAWLFCTWTNFRNSAACISYAVSQSLGLLRLRPPTFLIVEIDFLNYYFICMGVLPSCIFVHNLCAVVGEVREGVGVLETGIIGI